MELLTSAAACSWISHCLSLLQLLSDGADHKALNFQHLLCKTDINQDSNKLQPGVLQQGLMLQTSQFGCSDLSPTFLISLKLKCSLSS